MQVEFLLHAITQLNPTKKELQIAIINHELLFLLHVILLYFED